MNQNHRVLMALLAAAWFHVAAGSLGVSWSLNEGGRELLLTFDQPLPSLATNAAAWSLSKATVVSARFFADGNGVALKLAKPLDTRSTYALNGPGVLGLAVKRPRPLALPERLLRGAVEAAGPSSRRTAIAVTEVQAAPAVGRDLRFVELYNSNPYPERIGGWRLSGGLVCTIPQGCQLAGNAYLVVAADAAAVRTAYGIDNVVQAESAEAFALPCELSLWDEQGAALGTVALADEEPWPAGIAHTGHSLTLARPSWGWTVPDGWSRSALPGGSPGRAEPPRPAAYAGVVLNEVLPHGDEPGFVELYNTADAAATLAGCTVEVVGTTNAPCVIAAGRSIAAHRTFALDEATLGFPVGGEGVEVVLRAPAAAGGWIIDALRIPPTEKGRAYGRYPDGGPLASRLEFPTPDERNAPRVRSEVVLNELMYHPITESKDEEYVELRNLSGEAVDLTGWSLAGDVEYAFGEMIAADGYLVVTKKKKAFDPLYPAAVAVRAKDNYSGSLPNSRGRVQLRRRLTAWSAAAGGAVEVDVPVEEVRYLDGGAWGRWSDGGGSSLERVDPGADARLAGSWADSDESGTCDWKTIEWTGAIELGNYASGHGNPDEVQFGLYDAGECLVDSVELMAEGGANLVRNPSFEQDNADANWRALGTHARSAIETGVAAEGRRAIHLRACDRLTNGGNGIHGWLASALPMKGRGTIRARVKWLAGSPDFLIRARGNWIEASGDILTTRAMGTPGRANSREAGAAAPTISAVTHLPVLPKAGETVAVWARIDAADGVAGADLVWRLDGSADVRRTAMEAADGGWWRGEIPGADGGAIAAFHVEARGADARSRRSRFPVETEGLVRFGEKAEASAFGVYRVWVASDELNRWYRQNRDSNEPRAITFVQGEDRVIYGAGAEYGGSSWNGKGYPQPGTASAYIDYKTTFPKDEPFLGDDGLVLATPGNRGSDKTAVKEQFAYALLRRLGRPNLHRRFVHVVFNGVAQDPMTLHEDTEKPNGEVLEHFFPEKDDGRLYKLDDWFEYDVNTFTNFTVQSDAARLASYRGADGAYKVARYRWPWMPRAYDNFQPSDYTDFFGLIDAVNASPALSDAELEKVFNSRALAEVLAVNHFICNDDSYGYGRGKNMYLYQGPSGWEFIAWDLDYSFGDSGLSLTTNLDPNGSFSCGDPVAKTILRRPVNLRRYWRAIAQCIAAADRGSVEHAEARAKYDALAAENSVLKDIESEFFAKVEIRRTNAVAQLTRVDAQAFAVTSPAQAEVSVGTNRVTFAGAAPFAVEQITFNGEPAEIVWTSATSWKATLTLTKRTTPVTVRAVASDGTVLATGGFTVRGVPTESGDAPTVAINEFMATNELFTNPVTGGQDDWFELCNYGTAAVDLSGWVVTDTLATDAPPTPNTKATKSLTFPAGFSLGARQVLLIWTGGVDESRVDDVTCLQAPFGLGKSADSIYLFDAEMNLIDQVSYDTTQSKTASQGRRPDGTGAWTTLDPPSPGAPNGPVLTFASAPVRLLADANGAGAYPVEMCTNLQEGAWSPFRVSPIIDERGTLTLPIDLERYRRLHPAAFFRLSGSGKEGGR